MDELKKGYREGEETAKESWRNRDGEDLADKVGNIGDDIRKGLGNLGDDARGAGKDIQREVERHTDDRRDRV